jgi:hypothetical protein
MKKIFFTLSIAVFAFAAQSQSTTPRFGTTASGDNTGRGLTYAYKSVTDAAGADSVAIYPSSFQTIVRVSLIDSFYIKSPVVTRSFAGDKLIFIASGASGKMLKFAGTNFITAGTATLSAGGRAVISLIFDGAKWVEAYRTVQ